MTTFTCGADEPAKMALAAQRMRGGRALKLKLTGEPADAERVLAVRKAREAVGRLGFDRRHRLHRAERDGRRGAGQRVAAELAGEINGALVLYSRHSSSPSEFSWEEAA